MLKQVLGSLLAALLLFVWSAVSWMVLGIQDKTLNGFRDEASVVSILSSNAPEPGMYVIPSPQITEGMTADQIQAAKEASMEKAAQGPVALISWYPNQSPGMARAMITQFLTAFLACFLLLGILRRMHTGYGTKIWTSVLVFLIAGLLVDVPYWNWWHFSNEYTLGQLGDHVVSGLLAGLVLGRFNS